MKKIKNTVIALLISAVMIALPFDGSVSAAKNVNINLLRGSEYVPVGKPVGIVLETDGVLVLGTGRVRDAMGGDSEPCKGILRSGDMIKSVNGVRVNTKEEFSDAVRHSPSAVRLEIDRLEKPVEITPVITKENIPMLGLWVRDSTQGIGTVTYYRKSDGAFGALGHPVTDVDTGSIMQIKGGTVYPVIMQGIVKGEKGAAGELAGRNADNETVLGTADKNCGAGVYGKLSDTGIKLFDNKPVPIALKESVKKGRACILADIDGKGVQKYDIEIESVNSFSGNTSKGMVIKITDKRLIDKTGGIVQGMSGCPILQNNCLVGAVTHVFINAPQKGYGIFIENMLLEN